MILEDRVSYYKTIFPECKAIDPVKKIIAKDFKGKTPLGKLELLRELDTELADLYKVWLPVITCWVRDNSYVRETKEIYLTEPEIEGFLHEFRHHLQNEAREQSKKLLLVEDKTDIDTGIPFKDAECKMYGEDDARAWAKMIIESV